jgi:hypothetical protein
VWEEKVEKSFRHEHCEGCFLASPQYRKGTDNVIAQNAQEPLAIEERLHDAL